MAKAGKTVPANDESQQALWLARHSSRVVWFLYGRRVPLAAPFTIGQLLTLHPENQVIDAAFECGLFLFQQSSVPAFQCDPFASCFGLLDKFLVVRITNWPQHSGQRFVRRRRRRLTIHTRSLQRCKP